MQKKSVVQKIAAIISELQEQVKLLSQEAGTDLLDIEMMLSNTRYLEAQLEILKRSLHAKEIQVPAEPQVVEPEAVSVAKDEPVKIIREKPEPILQEQEAVSEPLSSTKTTENRSKESLSTLNDKLKAGHASLNETLNVPGKGSALVGELSRQNINDLNAAITLNERFLLTRELFNGDNKQFSVCLDHINNLERFGDAEAYLQQEIAGSYNWKDKQEAVSIFYRVLQRKFNE